MGNECMVGCTCYEYWSLHLIQDNSTIKQYCVFFCSLVILNANLDSLSDCWICFGTLLLLGYKVTSNVLSMLLISLKPHKEEIDIWLKRTLCYRWLAPTEPSQVALKDLCSWLITDNASVICWRAKSLLVTCMPQHE